MKNSATQSYSYYLLHAIALHSKPSSSLKTRSKWFGQGKGFAKRVGA
uniref:Uncharacterized protein n=1 Tax=Anguilla anguilla TaxID=7936 RepID=A0A0E9VND7_ANGAN